MESDRTAAAAVRSSDFGGGGGGDTSSRRRQQQQVESANEAFLTTNDDDEKDKEALDFQDTDPAFRIFICNYPVAPVFVVISLVKLLLLLAALFTTIAQLVVVHSAASAIASSNSTTTTTIIAADSPSSSSLSPPPQWLSSSISSSTVSSGGTTDSDSSNNNIRTSWASAIFYFEPSWWSALAYLRLTMAIVAIFSVLCGLVGIWRQIRQLLLATATTDCGLVVFLLGYLILLAWHAVKYDDYFAFCIGGLSLLCLLLISVMGLHAAVLTYRYLKAMLRFVRAARQRWPDAYREARETVRRRIENGDRGFVLSIYDRLTERYAVVEEIRRIESQELAVLTTPTTTLLRRHDDESMLRTIEEMEDDDDDDEEGEQLKR